MTKDEARRIAANIAKLPDRAADCGEYRQAAGVTDSVTVVLTKCRNSIRLFFS
jgi:hypothetical protein